MNSLHIIGNLTNDPELRTTSTGKEVCNFTVAVNRRKTQENQDPGADFFRVAAWGEKGKVCKQYLAKGRKVSVVGSVSCRAYSKENGDPAASLEVRADDVEFLSSKSEQAEQPKIDAQSGFQQVNPDDMPY